MWLVHLVFFTTQTFFEFVFRLLHQEKNTVIKVGKRNQSKSGKEEEWIKWSSFLLYYVVPLSQKIRKEVKKT